MQNNDQKQIAGAILVVGILIAGAILLKGSKLSNPITVPTNNNGVTVLAPVTNEDRTLGDKNAKITIVVYEDFQCPFCGAITGLDPNGEAIAYLKQSDPNWTPFMPEILNNYVKNGDAQFVYRDYAFLGPESVKSAEAARCAGDQGKFWEYHDYLYSHQNGENKGGFADANLKSFAKKIGLNSTDFDKCLDGGKYTQAVADSTSEGNVAGVGGPGSGTPKGFILRDGQIVSMINGAEPLSSVKPKIDAALK